MSTSPYYATLATLLALLAAAVSTDLRSRRVPNALVLIGMVAAFLLHGMAFAARGPALAGAWWAPLVGAYVGLMVLMPMYLLRACGGGDVKLMAMIGAFVGPGVVLWAALYTLLAGGLMSLVFMADRTVRSRALANVHQMANGWAYRAHGAQAVRVEPLRNTAMRMPYAVAIAAGTLFALRGALGV